MANGTPGRPSIGPKVQTNIADPKKAWIAREARRRGVDEAVVVRQIIDEWFDDRSILLAAS